MEEGKYKVHLEKMWESIVCSSLYWLFLFFHSLCLVSSLYSVRWFVRSFDLLGLYTINIGNIQPDPIYSALTITGSSSGTNNAINWNCYSQSFALTLMVIGGETVTVTGAYYVTAGAPLYSSDNYGNTGQTGNENKRNERRWTTSERRRTQSKSLIVGFSSSCLYLILIFTCILLFAFSLVRIRTDWINNQLTISI